MIFILPLSHEHTVVKRLPVITILLIIVNTILYGFTAVRSPESTEELYDTTFNLIEYYYEHPYLEMPEQTKEKLFYSHEDLLEKVENQSVTLPISVQVNYEQSVLNSAVNDYEEAFRNEFYRKYGYIPARGGILTTVTSMFLHGGFFHLLFNMIFLFLSGYILEDYWGRAVYLLFYMASGMIATWTHGAMFPNSYIPLVGASGAVAGLMGAFLVRFFKTRIYFFYFIFIIRFWVGRFLAPAYIMLSLWLGEQVIMALMDDGKGAGVAFWAHIGGFVFGVGFALVFKFLKIEERFISDAIEKKVTMFDAASLNAGKSIKNLAENMEDDGFVRKERASQYLAMGERNKALFECKRALVTLIKDQEFEAVMDYYAELIVEFPDLSLTQDYQMKIVDLFESEHRLKEAAQACKNLAYTLKDLGDKELMNQAVKRYKHIVNVYQENKTLKKTARPHGSPGSGVSVSDANGKSPTTGNGSARDWDGVVLVDTMDHDAGELLNTVEPRYVRRVNGCSEKGLFLQGTNRDILAYDDIVFATVYQVDGDSAILLDLFVKGEMRPFRVNSAGIAYGEICPGSSSNMLESFRGFVVFLLEKLSLVYTDLGTQSFAINKAPQFYGSERKAREYERKIWSNLINTRSN